MAAWARVRRSRAGALAAAVAFALTPALAGGHAVAAAAKPTAPPSGPPWYFGTFDMNDVWKVSSGGQVVVAVVSGGVGSPSEMLQNALIPGGDVSSDGGSGGTGDVLSAYDGTQVASLIAAKSTAAVEGMAPGASILPVRDIAKGEQSSDAAETARGIAYAADHGATVILVVDTGPKMDQGVAAAVAHAQSKGAIVVAPSGNTGLSSNVVNAMCAFDGVVCVGATGKDGSRWPNSASGSRVDLAAPGVDVTVPTPSGGTRSGSSTHYSAALVAAEAALIRSAHPTWDAGQVISVMLQNTDGGKADHTRVSDKVGYGVIKPLAALHAAVPSSTANPLSTATPQSATPTPHRTSAAPAPGQARPSAASGSSSGGSGSGTILLIVGAAVIGLAIIGLIAWLVLRNRGGGGNYLTDPAYRAGHYYDQASGPTSQLGGYQDWNAPPPGAPGPQGPYASPSDATAPQPFPSEQPPPPYWQSRPMQPAPPTSEPLAPPMSGPVPPPMQEPPTSEPAPPQPSSEPELGAGYTQPFAGELPPPQPPATPEGQEEPDEPQRFERPENRGPGR